MSRAPVILPAYNEEARIGKTLDSLPASLVEPLVVVNGSTDKTADVARGYGARVLELETQGKLPAIQAAWRRLGNKALGPTLILDADNYPLFPHSWARGMLNVTFKDPEAPTFVGGPVWFSESSFLYNTLRSVKRLKLAAESRHWQTGRRPGQLGPNTGLHIKDKELLEKLLALPHYWPGEDRAMMDTVVNHGGNFYQPISPRLMTMTPSSESFIPLSERLRRGQTETHKIVIDSYIERGAPGSLPYPDADYSSRDAQDIDELSPNPPLLN